MIYPGYVPFLYSSPVLQNYFKSLRHWKIKGQPKPRGDLSGKHFVDGWFIRVVLLSVQDVCGHLPEVFM